MQIAKYHLIYNKVMKCSIRIAAICLFLFQGIALRAQFGVNSVTVPTKKDGNTLQFRMPDGSVAKVTHNADGSTNWVLNMQCSFCFATGTCQSCYGQGGKQIGSYRFGYWNPCTGCASTGRCGRCKGSGRTELYCYFDQHGNGRMIDPVTFQMTYFNANSIGITPQVRERETREYYSSKNTSEPIPCPNCHGDKSYREKMGVPNMYPSDYVKICPECHEAMSASLHIHTKCQVCWGRGYFK